MFDGIARRYDLLNHLLSLGVDRGWRRRVVRAVRAERPRSVLDMATGTADLAIMLAKSCPGARVVGVDLSERMLAVGRSKVERESLSERIELVQGDAESAAYGREAFDAATVAFGVRNFEHLELGLQEMYRVLKTGGKVIILGGLTGLFSALRPGGKLFVLEFGMPRGRIFGTVYRFYFHRVLPRLGGWVSRDGKAYSYLPRSVDEFPYGEAFVRLLAEAGFEDCDCRNLFGGVAQIYTARRPDACEKTEKRR